MVRNKSRAKNRRGRPSAQTKSQNDVKPNARKCDECHSIVPNGTDMYRFHCTRLTVCRNCWITMDPSKDKLKRRSRQIDTSNLAETKLCAVFLTDVLDKKSNKNEKEHKIEKNKDNKSYIMSEDSSLEDRLSELLVNSAVNNNIKRGKKRQIDAEKKEDVESTPTKIIKLSTKRENASEAKISSDVEQQSTTYSTRRGHKRTNTANDRSSDSDVSSPLGSRKKLDDRAKLSSPSSSKPDRKKLKTILQGVTANVHSQSTDESSIEDTNLGKTTENVSNAHTNKEKNAHKRTRSSSVSSTETTSLAEFKSPKSVAEVKKNCHTCDTCGKKFDTKVANVEHGLTHLMQASLKLERVTISNIKEKQELKIDSEEDKIVKEAKVFLTKTVSIDKHTDDPSEEIAINVVDTDEEEIFSLSKEQSTKKEEAKKETSSEDYNVTDKLDAESKLYVEESAKIQSDEKMVEESEQCVESTAVPNETETSIEIEQGKDTKEMNTKNNNIRENDTKDKDRKVSMDRDIDTLIEKDTNVQKDTIVKDMSSSTTKFSYCNKLCTKVDVDENKDVSDVAENDTKMLTKEKEKSNNEKEHLLEEIPHDSKATKSLVSSINNTINQDDNNKNHNESCKSDLKNICKDNESEIIKDVEMTQCELTHDNKSQKENIDESEKTVDVTDETEKLKDQIDLNDTVVMDEDKVEILEKQQDTTNDQNMETEVIIDDDKPNNATDTVKSDFLNGEKLNQAENGDEIENDIVIIPADSNKDIIQYTKDTEKTITIDSSNEKDKLEETIKNLEDLFENNKMNNKYEEQENSNHTLNDSPIDAANMILKEVFDLAAAEVEKREDINNTKDLQDTEIETLENITREIRNSADMPSLDPISIMDIDDDNDITLN